MNRSTVAAIGGAAVGLAGAAAAVYAFRRSAPGPDRLLYRPSDKLDFTERVPGVTQAVIWGDPDKGAHAGFTRFAPGVEVPLHTHSHDVVLVVISGAYIYRPTMGEEIRVGPRSYLFVPGGTPHVSLGDPIEGCLFYQEGTESFDLNFLEEKRGKA